MLVQFELSIYRHLCASYKTRETVIILWAYISIRPPIGPTHAGFQPLPPFPTASNLSFLIFSTPNTH
ncbi:hypothetical protein L2E82_40487 [Cichorium intybus]|uniref:Uncharacterized protein n=1 Tax=Cichorium intybus TaxID=13427 RepID=A0ACB9ALH0_CICIN|nr:hypothetical protein L2E82_40487 [Cichorium intybus]